MLARGVGVLVLLTFGDGGGGGVMQNRESPDFGSPEVGRYVRLTKNWQRALYKFIGILNYKLWQTDKLLRHFVTSTHIDDENVDK